VVSIYSSSQAHEETPHSPSLSTPFPSLVMASSPTSQDPTDVLSRMSARMEELSAQVMQLTHRSDEDQTLIAALRQQLTATAGVEAAAQRRSLISNSRTSILVQPISSTVTMGVVAPSIRDGVSDEMKSPAYVPHRAGRQTMSPQGLTTPVPAPPRFDDEAAEEGTHSGPMDPARVGGFSDKQHASLLKSIEAPVQFSGDVTKDKVPDVRDWTDKMDAHFQLHVGKARKGLIPFVQAKLEGAAAHWLKSKRRETAALLQQGLITEDVEWDEIVDEFINLFEGGEFKALKEMELEAMRLWKGECKTLPMFHAHFDKLTRRMHPAGFDMQALDSTLAKQYSDILKESDLDLWGRACMVSIPRTLQQWKEQTIQAWSVRAVLKEQAKKGAATTGQTIPFKPQLGAQLHGMNATGTGGEDGEESAARAERQPESTSVHAMGGGGGGKGKAGGRGAAGGSGGNKPRTPFLSDSEYGALRDQNKCYRCFSSACRAGMDTCPMKGKARRHPTAEELKA
jgi:hypothetical protein